MNSKKNNIKSLEINTLKYYVYTPKRIYKATLIYYLYSVSIVKILKTGLGIIWLVVSCLQVCLFLNNKHIRTN
jgi:hypothetical protein